MADDHAAPGAQIADHAAAAVVHDPLPEATWGWRRSFIFVLTTVSVAGIWLMVQSIRDVTAANPDLAVGAFVKIIGWVLMFDWCIATYYLVAPTGEQITRWVQTAGMLKSGVQLATSAAVRGIEGSSAQTTTVAGQAFRPPVPEVDAAPTSRK